jgi:regulator of protease activity HflC (stomatin/prohibitin superfamily)
VTERPSAPAHQAVRITAVALSMLMVLTALAWLTSNVRQIAPGNRAVVFRLGSLSRVQDSGLLWALPEPFEKVELLPAAAAVIERRIEGLARLPEADSDAGLRSDALAGSGYLLTGDASVVQLDVRLFYRVNNPFDYVLQGSHVLPTLDRLATRAAVLIAASRDIDRILVARPELVDANSDVAVRRESLRADLVRNVNESLQLLKADHAGLGVEIDRADIQSSLPGSAVSAFDAVLTASQQAEQAVAAARSEAEKDRQVAEQGADSAVQMAEARSSERLAKARSATATISGFASKEHLEDDPALIVRLYRDRVAKILSQAGSVTTIDPKDDARLILQGSR